NFGCGSSREHAPWALVGWGFRAVISTSFADIFKNNSLKNGLLPVEVSPELLKNLFAACEKDRTTKIEIDLATLRLTAPDGTTATFEVDDFARHCLLHGIDEMGYLLSLNERIDEYEAQRTAAAHL